MDILGLIPARSGSRGVPNKNTRYLMGKPLIAWAIEEALRSRHLTRVVVSTDCPNIASIAKGYGAEVPFLRPVELATDVSPDIEFMKHALSCLYEGGGYEPEIVVRLPPTAPLRTALHIDKGIEILWNTPNADSVRPITDAPKHPFKMWKITEGFLEPAFGEKITGLREAHNMPRQLLPEVYIQTGAMDVVRVRTLTELNSTSGQRVSYFYMSPEDSVNIDSEIDFLFAEFLLARRPSSSLHWHTHTVSQAAMALGKGRL
jgi:CMP-N,N'-diacetyllegionaminic acid synthase